MDIFGDGEIFESALKSFFEKTVGFWSITFLMEAWYVILLVIYKLLDGHQPTKSTTADQIHTVILHQQKQSQIKYEGIISGFRKLLLFKKRGGIYTVFPGEFGVTSKNFRFWKSCILLASQDLMQMYVCYVFIYSKHVLWSWRSWRLK